MSAVLDQPQTADLRSRLTTLRQELVRIEGERQRCDAEAQRHRKVVDALPLAQTALADLHERRTSGENIPDKQIEQAEERLRNAQTTSDRAELAERGARAAERRFREQFVPIQQAIASAQAEARIAISVILRERVEASRTQYRRDAEAFATTAHARHHGTIQALRDFAASVGITDVAQWAVPVPPAGVVEFLTTPTPREEFAIFSVDARQSIKAAAQAYAEDLPALTSGLL